MVVGRGRTFVVAVVAGNDGDVFVVVVVVHAESSDTFDVTGRTELP